MRYFAKVSYLGCAYSGFQFQPNRPTVQGEVNRACLALFGVPCAVTGCSRTDSGVHAEDFSLTIDVGEGGAAIPPSALPRAIAPHLPKDISLFYACEADENFHARYDVAYKEYQYRIVAAPLADPFLDGRAWQYHYPLLPDAQARMERAAAHFVGKKDFAAFKNDDGTEKNTVRTVKWLKVDLKPRTEVLREDGIKADKHLGFDLTVSIAADGFLYNMVRIIVGTLTDVAVGRIAPDDIPKIFERGERRLAGVTAPPDGLYLHRVVYRRLPKIDANF